MKHREAIEYDLMTRTGYSFDDIGRALSWSAFNSFLTYIETDSATARILNEDVAEWSSRWKTNEILANIFDAINVTNAYLVALISGKKPKQPKPYPRPQGKDDKPSQMTTAEMIQKLRDKMRDQYVND